MSWRTVRLPWGGRVNNHERVGIDWASLIEVALSSLVLALGILLLVNLLSERTSPYVLSALWRSLQRAGFCMLLPVSLADAIFGAILLRRRQPKGQARAVPILGIITGAIGTLAGLSLWLVTLLLSGAFGQVH